MPWKAWGDVFRHYISNGHDSGSAAYAADEWEKRRDRRNLAAAVRDSVCATRGVENCTLPHCDCAEIGDRAALSSTKTGDA